MKSDSSLRPLRCHSAILCDFFPHQNHFFARLNAPSQFAGKQPEDITPEEWSVIDAELRNIEETSEADRRS